MRFSFLAVLLVGFSVFQSWPAGSVWAQSVGLPAPRLLTIMPMGGVAGTEFEIAISGDHFEEADQLYFSDPRITATPVREEHSKNSLYKYKVKIAADCPKGIYEARVMTRLGISSARVFSVGSLPEVLQKSPNQSLQTAMPLDINCICNAVMAVKAIDYYSFEAKKGTRYLIQCDSKVVDSKLDAVLILANGKGNDLIAERRGGVIDFVAKEDGKHVVKIHELTFKGGPAYFYRLSIREWGLEDPLPEPLPTNVVNSFSWPPNGLPDVAAIREKESESQEKVGQEIALPCDIAGRFYPAADVDIYEFQGKKGDSWWIEIASERLGFPTDPSVLVQRSTGEGESRKWEDVVEFSDIPSPIKVSSNGYAYDGPPYDPGTSDVLGKFDVAEDGRYRILVNDLFGGTRSDPRNAYRLVVRKAAPDFALVAWGLHMELRNGDRNALSKPIALRGGGTMALEVIAFRRDGFDGEIELEMEGLPAGVSARGIKIPAGKSRGIMLVTAEQNAPRAVSNAKLIGRGVVQGNPVIHPCRLAEMKWPIPDSWGEIPEPRLVKDVAVSVSGLEFAPLSIAPSEKKVFEGTVGSKMTIPLVHTKRSEFSAATIQFKTFGDTFERQPVFNISATSDVSEAVLDLGTLKAPPGDYWIAFYGGVVAKYQYFLEGVTLAEEAQRKADAQVKALQAELEKTEAIAKTASADKKADLDKAHADLASKRKAAEALLASTNDQLKAAIEKSKPKDIVDIVVSEPIAIRVMPSEKK